MSDPGEGTSPDAPPSQARPFLEGSGGVEPGGGGRGGNRACAGPRGFYILSLKKTQGISFTLYLLWKENKKTVI